MAVSVMSRPPVRTSPDTRRTHSLKIRGYLEGSFTPEDRAMVLGHLKEEKGMTKPDAIDFRIISRGGKARWISHRCKPVYDSEGVYLGQRGSQRDITEERQIQQTRERARQLEGLRTLAGGISHDYNNLLAIILGNLSLVREDKTLGLETLGFLEEIEQASLAAKDLTRRLMTLTKGGATFNWKTDSIKSLLEGCISQNLKRSTVICNAMIPEKFTCGLPWIRNRLNMPLPTS